VSAVRRRAAVAVVGALVAAGCASTPRAALDRGAPPAPAAPSSTAGSGPGSATVGATPSAPSTTAPAAAPGPAAPEAARNPVALAEQLVRVETAIRDPATPPGELAEAAELQQVAYRRLGRHPEWDGPVLARVPDGLRPTIEANADARREFASMHTEPVSTMPAWRIVEPPPADDLLEWYAEGEATYGVPWFYLAAVNLVETGFGRIRGTSVAGALGPMQFMPATWAAFGEGDVNDPHDAILAAARYLAHNGAPVDMPNALWNYNHSWPYVRGVSDLAGVMRDDTRAFHGYYHWQVYLSTVAGDVLLPVGYEEARPVPVGEWLAEQLGGD
jgi:soluble lytic murein transglycosylase-like protein